MQSLVNVRCISFTELGKQFKICMETIKPEYPKHQEEQAMRQHISSFQTILQGYNYQTCVVLA